MVGILGGTKLDTDSKLQAELHAERDYHNRKYQHTTPFDLPTHKIDIDSVWGMLKPVYEKGGQIRGQRNRRFFELMDLGSISGKQVVDFGCGDGSASVFAAIHGAKVVGFDISEVGVEQANYTAQVNEVDENCKFFVGNAADTGLTAESADLIIMKAVLHHFIKYPGINNEIWRVLKPGGKIVFADIVRDNATYNFFTKLYHLTGVETDRGETISIADYRQFSSQYQNVYFEHSVLLEAVKRVIPAKLMRTFGARMVVKSAASADSLLLKKFKSLESKTLEIVGSMQKPLES